MLFDTSIWIDFLKGTKTAKTNHLEDCLFNGNIYMCPPVFQEILQGIRTDKEYKEIQSLITLGIEKLENDPFAAAEGAATLYRSLKNKGLTVRRPNDCLIAWYSISHNCQLVHNDVDFDVIAQHFPLDCWEE